jgi:predicted O-linked N-acetylglucosamine transferase (SPINDLY family)
LNLGLIEQLSRQRFDVTVFSVGASDEPLAIAIRQAADRFVPLSVALEPARQAIASADLDVLFYTDLGMDPITYSLAFSRLAPIQCVTWGHPVTSGIPAIDYFISSELLEDDRAQSQYTERLVRLKNLAVCYHRPTLSAGNKTRADFGLPPDATLYGCLQMLQKFHPDFDPLIADILRQDPDALLLLVRGLNRNWDDLLLKRFSRTLGDVLDRVRFLPRMSYDDFLWLTSLCDVMLDPIHFGGGNTSYEAFAFGVPVVTLPSPFLRGRISLALYRMMGIDDFTARDPETYIQLASSLGKNTPLRQAARDQILNRCPVLYHNQSGLRELETFLIEHHES